jgi:hypothetical protein
MVHCTTYCTLFTFKRHTFYTEPVNITSSMYTQTAVFAVPVLTTLTHAERHNVDLWHQISPKLDDKCRNYGQNFLMSLHKNSFPFADLSQNLQSHNKSLWLSYVPNLPKSDDKFTKHKKIQLHLQARVTLVHWSHGVPTVTNFTSHHKVHQLSQTSHLTTLTGGRTPYIFYFT